MIAVVKVGTSSITRDDGTVDDDALTKLGAEIADARAAQHQIILVSSGAIATGLPVLGFVERPRDMGTLQAVAAVGQPRLMAQWSTLLSTHNLVAGQVLLTPNDFGQRSQYLHARATLARLLELGVVPVVNENDTIADDEIRYGDNDRLAALVSHLVDADLLVLLTDTSGVLDADPRVDERAELIEVIAEVDAALEAVAGGAGTARGSGGMASKLAAAKIAAWSGVRVVIANAQQPGVVRGAIEGTALGTVVKPRPLKMSRRKLWIAFALGATGRIVVDDGARKALVDGGRSLLPAGVRSVEGFFYRGEAVEVTDLAGRTFAKGLAGAGADALRAVAGRQTADLPDGVPHEIIHRDDLVILP